MSMVAPVANAADPTDCTSGCEIATCASSYCTVSHCDAGKCLAVGGYDRIQPESNLVPEAGSPPMAFGAVCDVAAKQACAIKTCADGECSISVFDGKFFVAVGQVKDVDKLIEKANADFAK